LAVADLVADLAVAGLVVADLAVAGLGEDSDVVD
jgi:hypothetical protein